MISSDRWVTVQESTFPWEREALAYLRAQLTAHEPYRAWSNFEFVADDGSINEVDLLVVSLHRVYLVEIKSAPGRVEGDPGTWTWTDGGRVHSLDNPLLLANRKAKKLKSLLARQPALKQTRVPYVEPLVFLSNRGVQCRLEGPARTGVYLRSDTERDGNPSITQILSGEKDTGGPGARIDAPLSRGIARALESAGIRPTQSHRQVGDYTLESLLNETDVFQDWEAKHVRFEATRRRIRIYPNALQSSDTSRAERMRAAEREFRLLDGVDHPGILQVKGFTEHERGPALIFEHPVATERMDVFLRQRLPQLDLRQRLALVRQIAETLQFAHGRRLYHQSLTPQSILVVDAETENPTVKLFNWQAGQSQPTTDAVTRLTVDDIVKVGLAGEAKGAVYLAPELYSVGALDPARVDAFSLGALAYHIVGGAAPAASIEELHAKLKRGSGLRLSESMDGVGERLDELVQIATDPDTSDRWDVAEFLAELDAAIAELDVPDPGSFVHPLDAGQGDELEGGFLVRQRLGKGSTAVALLVEQEGREGVLKVALRPDLNDRLEAEAEVLRPLRHQNVVELFDVVSVSGHTALFMQAAGTRSSDDRPGSYTLAQRIREEGRLSLDLLQRFGEELLIVVDWLEKEGISHRDLKPDNIGIGQTPKRTLTLVLFDFSLSGTPAENIRAGTPPYLDPFLAERKPPRWDPYAERFAAAVTLYEMATGQLPTWGDGRSHPGLVDDEVSLDVELLDPSVRDDLARFFRKALARDYRARHDNAEEMRRAWARAFEGIDAPSTTAASDTDAVDVADALDGATGDTPIVSLPLSARVLNALERMGVHTLRELQELPRIRLYRNKGIGQRTVKDIRALAETVAEFFAGRSAAAAPAAEQDSSVDPRYWSVDLVHRRLVSKQADPDEAAILRGLLGTDPIGGHHAAWPAQQDVAEGLSYPREDVRRVVEQVRERWRKDRPAWSGPLRDDVAALLDKHGGVMTREELVAALLTARGSASPEPDRTRAAAAVAYAALEVEAGREGARYILYRGIDHVFVVATPQLGEAFVATPAARGRYAEILGSEADRLAEADPLLLPERVIEELAAVAPLEDEAPLPPDRLLRLAVAASRTAALSSRMELYPRGMAAERALKLGAGSLLGPRRLPPEMIQDRVASRYPDAERLPGRPALDALLEAAGLHLRWNPDEKAFTPPGAYGSLAHGTTSLTRRTTTVAPLLDAPGVTEALALEQRLERVALQRRLLVLTVAPGHHARAEAELLSRFGLQKISLEGRLLRAMHAAAESAGARWDVVLQADAAEPTSRDRRNLQRLVDRAVTDVEAELVALDQPALLVYPGLLARYGRLDLVERLRQACEAGRAPGFVLLVAADARSTMPVIDRAPLPLVHASDWARIPAPWLQNDHRGRSHAASSPD